MSTIGLMYELRTSSCQMASISNTAWCAPGLEPELWS